MKNIISIVALSLLSSFSIIISGGKIIVPGGKHTFRSQVEQQMYERSGKTLSENEYKKLVTPFLDRAETELKAAQFCEQNQDCEECKYYADSFVDYNVRSFLNYVQNNDKTNFYFENKRTALRSSIIALAKQGALPQDAVEAELQKTEQLCQDGNKVYYSALPSTVKIGLWLSK